MSSLRISEQARARNLFLLLLGKKIYFEEDGGEEDTFDNYKPEKIIRNLDKDLSIIEYQLIGDKLITWVIERDKLYSMVKTIPDIREILSRFRKNISGGLVKNEELEKLYLTLFASSENLISNKKIIIIPNGILNYIPFSALYDGSVHLLEKYSIAYSSSLSVYKILKDKKSMTGERRIVAVANPMISGESDQYSIFDSKGIPFAEKEVVSIKNWFPDITDIYLQKDATEKRVKSVIPSYHLIHLACHAEFNHSEPLLSALKFNSGENENGDLTVAEIFNLNLNADLVTLSACETGLGEIHSGDEVTGLAGAFIHAGSKSVISTLWRIDDVATAMLIKGFYRYLPNMSKAEALQEAKKTVRLIFPNPLYWSGVVLYGDPE